MVRRLFFSLSLITLVASGVIGSWRASAVTDGFDLSVFPSTLHLDSASADNLAISLKGKNGFSGTVTVSASGLPTGIPNGESGGAGFFCSSACAAAPNADPPFNLSVRDGEVTAMNPTLMDLSDPAEGTYTVTFTASASGYESKSKSMTVIVDDPVPSRPNLIYSSGNHRASVTAGQSASLTLSYSGNSSLTPYTGTATFVSSFDSASTSGVDSSMSGSFSPGSVNMEAGTTGTTTFTVSTTTSTPNGTYAIGLGTRHPSDNSFHTTSSMNVTVTGGTTGASSTTTTTTPPTSSTPTTSTSPGTSGTTSSGSASTESTTGTSATTPPSATSTAAKKSSPSKAAAPETEVPQSPIVAAREVASTMYKVEEPKLTDRQAYTAWNLAQTTVRPELAQPFTPALDGTPLLNPPTPVNAASVALDGCGRTACQTRLASELDQSASLFATLRERTATEYEAALAATRRTWQNPYSILDPLVAESFATKGESPDSHVSIETRLARDFPDLARYQPQGELKPGNFRQRCWQGSLIVLYNQRRVPNEAGTEVPVYRGDCGQIVTTLRTLAQQYPGDGVIVSSKDLSRNYWRYDDEWQALYKEALKAAIEKALTQAHEEGVVLRELPDGRGLAYVGLVGESAVTSVDAVTVERLAQANLGTPQVSLMTVTRPRPSSRLLLNPVHAQEESADSPQVLTNYVDIQVEGVPLGLLLTDPAGRSVGYNQLADSELHQLEEAIYEGVRTDRNRLIVPGLLAGQYELAIIALADGDYTGTIRVALGDEVTEQPLAGRVTAGQVVTESLAIEIEAPEPFALSQTTPKWLIATLVSLGIAVGGFLLWRRIRLDYTLNRK